MREDYQVLVVGAGPAGLAAARAAAAHGARVGLIDAAGRAGGQVWRPDWRHGQPRMARRALRAALAAAGVDFLAATEVVARAPGAVLVQDAQAARWLRHEALVLATGARELLLPFPGWTLPGVTGAGGLQALAKQGWPLAGRRVLVAGSGPLLWATAATARRHGASVVAIGEEQPLAAMAGFGAGLWRWPGKLAQAAGLRLRLAATGWHPGWRVLRADGEARVQTVTVATARGSRTLACDLLAVGYGLVPNVALAQLLGCRLDMCATHPAVAVDANQATSVAGVFAAGEVCGIGGRDCARIEGTLAGHAAVGARAPSPRLRRQRAHARAFADHLARHFPVRPELARRLAADTLVCRCEDVSWGALAGYTDARAAKLATRCGMGACQGRICGAALASLGRFPRAGQRPPLTPTRLASLATAPLPEQDHAT